MNTLEKKVNSGNNQQERIITKELKIMQNVFIYNETIIPLPNISRISLTAAPRQEYQISSFGAILIGLCLLFLHSSVLILIGLAIAAWGIWSIYKINKYNDDRGEYLVLCLNSGEKMYLHSKDHQFAIQIMKVIINCINSGNSYVVNMDNCTIENCNFSEITNKLFEG